MKPRSHSDTVLGVRSGLLHVSVTAVPDGGKANQAVERLFAVELGIPKSSVSVVRGHAARDKTVEFRGVTQDQVDTMVSRFPSLE